VTKIGTGRKFKMMAAAILNLTSLMGLPKHYRSQRKSTAKWRKSAQNQEIAYVSDCRLQQIINILELLAFNPPKCFHVFLATPPLLKNWVILSLGTCASNLKSVALTVLELLTFNDLFQASRLLCVPLT